MWSSVIVTDKVVHQKKVKRDVDFAMNFRLEVSVKEILLGS